MTFLVTNVFGQSTNRIYMVGNSVTDAINYDGFQALAESQGYTHVFARHMIPGSPLSWLWSHQGAGEGFTVDPYGPPNNAFPNYTWDCISLQPYDRTIDGADGDKAIIGNYINIAKAKNPNGQFYIHGHWPRTPNSLLPTDPAVTADTYTNQWLLSSMVANESRAYYEDLMQAVRSANQDIKPILIIPFGEVFYSLNLKMKAGQIPGYSKIYQVYADGIHLNSVGAYIVALTAYATMYKADPRNTQVPAQYGTIPQDVVNIFQQTVWDVVTTYAYSGVTVGIVPVTGVSLNASLLKMNTGQTFQLAPVFVPANCSNKNVNWSSSNTNILTVNSFGLVTAVSSGTASITVTTQDGNKTGSCSVSVVAAGSRIPYGNVVTAIPARIEIEKFDTGGEGVAYHDNDAANNGGQYRPTEGVDLDNAQDGGYCIGWTASGEWTEYTINIANAGTYKVDAIYSGPSAGSVEVSFSNGSKTTGDITMPATGGWYTWTAASSGNIALNAGEQLMRVTTKSGGSNLNAINVTSVSVNIPVTGISVTPTTKSLLIGELVQLTPTVSPSNASNTNVTYTSSNTAIASVNATGLVTALAAGTATITVKSQADNTKTATSTITVNQNHAPTAVITSTPASGTAPLNVSFSAANSTDPDAGDYILGFDWDFGDGSTKSTSNAPTHTYTTAGTYTVSLKVMDNHNLYGSVVTSQIVVNATSTQTPYTTAFALPCKIEIENYDNGGEGIAYHDNDVNNYGSSYRNDGVDIETCSEGGYNIGWTGDSEWLEYSVNVPNNGNYKIEIRYAGTVNGAAEAIFSNGNVGTGSISLPSTGAWQTWATASSYDIALNAGQQILKLNLITGGSNLNYINVIQSTDTQSPTAPTALVSSAISQTGFTLGWTASTDNVGVVSYEVFDGTTSKGTTTSTSIIITGLTCGTAHAMTVKAKDAAGNISSASNILNLTTSICPDLTSPSAPTALASSNITSNSCSLTWTASTDNVGVVAYEIFKNSVSTGTTTSTSYVVSGLAASTTYSFTVKAKDAAGNISAASTALNVTTTIALRDPENPAGTIAGLNYKYYEGAWTVIPNFSSLTPVKTGSVTTFDLTPRNINDNFGFEYTGFVNVPTDGTYTFYTRSDDGSNLYIGTTLVVNNDGLHGATEKSGSIGLKAGKHAIRINYFDKTGSQALTINYAGPGITKIAIPATALFRVDNIAPSIPTALTASSITVNSFTLNWTASTDNVGVSSYEVYAGPTLKGTTITTSMNITGLTCNTAYSMTVKAKDAAGNISAASTALNVTSSPCADTQAPSVPTGLASSNVTSNSFTLSWTASTDNVGVTAYDVFKGGTSIGTTTATSISVSGLSVSTSYSMTVKAKDAAGNISAASTALSVTTLAASGQTPYTSIIALPGTVEMENYDKGGEGIAYHDGDAANNGNQYRTTEGVDIDVVTGGYCIGWTGGGEWLEYSVNVANAGLHQMVIHYTANSTGTIEIAFDNGGKTSGDITLPVTGGFSNYTTITKNIVLNAGQQILRINEKSGGFNLDKVVFTKLADDVQAPSTPANLSAANITSYGFVLNWTASTDNVGVSSYEVFKNGVSYTTTTATSTTIYGVNPSTSYLMTVKAKDESNNVSNASLALNVTTASASNVTPQANAPLGTNLSGVCSWGTEVPFINLAKQSRGWGLLNASYTALPAASVDSRGYMKPGITGSTWLADDISVLPYGNYVIKYTGTATLELSGASYTIVSNVPGRIEFSFPQGSHGTLEVKVTSNSSTTPLNNFWVGLKDYENSTEVFNPSLISNWNKFKALRFMDWLATNGNTKSNWSERTLPESYSYATGEVPVEICVALSNKLNADGWFNIPAHATDDYITQFATVVKNNLNTNLKAYIEYSNEVWNGQFEQNNYAAQQGLALGFDATAWGAAWRYTAYRSVQMFTLWENVFGGAARLVRILPAQVSTTVVSTIMEFQNAYQHADVVAIAPYFSAFTATPTGSVDEIIALCRQEINTQDRQNLSDISALAAAKGLKIVAYEGGQHLTAFGDGSKMTNLIAVNKDPRIKDLYLEYLDMWKQSGGTLFMHFSSVCDQSAYGSWGSKEIWSQTRAQAPKYDALLTWIDNNPAWFTIKSEKVNEEQTKTFYDNSINVYPNPASDILNIDLTSDDNSISVVKLIDLNGKVVLANNFELLKGVNNFSLNTSDIRCGVYFIQIQNESKISNKKVLIVKK